MCIYIYTYTYKVHIWSSLKDLEINSIFISSVAWTGKKTASRAGTKNGTNMFGWRKTQFKAWQLGKIKNSTLNK